MNAVRPILIRLTPYYRFVIPDPSLALLSRLDDRQSCTTLLNQVCYGFFQGRESKGKTLFKKGLGKYPLTLQKHFSEFSKYEMKKPFR
jgi:hypothetical protein